MKGAVPKLMWLAAAATWAHNHFFFNTINGTRLLYMQDNYVEGHLLFNIRHSQYFQPHGSSPHFALCICACLDNKFSQHWHGRAGPLKGTAYSPDLTPPHDCWTWGMLKEHVYGSKPRDIQELQRRNEHVTVSTLPWTNPTDLGVTWKWFQVCMKAMVVTTLPDLGQPLFCNFLQWNQFW